MVEKNSIYDVNLCQQYGNMHLFMLGGRMHSCLLSLTLLYNFFKVEMLNLSTSTRWQHIYSKTSEAVKVRRASNVIELKCEPASSHCFAFP